METPAFSQTGTVFSMTCTVALDIHADAAAVWHLLTDAQGFPRWNSTVTKVEGEIRDRERLRLHVPGTTRTFRPKVSAVVPKQRMTWSDGVAPIFKGTRTFELTAHDSAWTRFVMKEVFTGVVFALVKRTLPDFRPIFEAYARDLKREAERLALTTPMRASVAASNS